MLFMIKAVANQLVRNQFSFHFPVPKYSKVPKPLEALGKYPPPPKKAVLLY